MSSSTSTTSKKRTSTKNESSSNSQKAKIEHTPKTQYKALSYITSIMDKWVIVAGDLKLYNPMISEDVCKKCHEKVTPDVSIDTLNQWWYDFRQFGELPYLVEKLEEERTKNPGVKLCKIDDDEEAVLKRIVKDDPDLSLDKIALAFGEETGKYLHYKTVWYILSEERDDLVEVEDTKIDRSKPFPPLDPAFTQLVEEIRGKTVMLFFSNYHGDLKSSRLVLKDDMKRVSVEQLIYEGVDDELQITAIEDCTFNFRKKNGSDASLPFKKFKKLKVKDIDNTCMITVMEY